MRRVVIEYDENGGVGVREAIDHAIQAALLTGGNARIEDAAADARIERVNKRA